MRVNDLKDEEVVVGLRIRSLVNPKKIGTVTHIDVNDDRWATVEWDPGYDGMQTSGFYGNSCLCEVVMQPSQELQIISGNVMPIMMLTAWEFSSNPEVGEFNRISELWNNE